MPYFYDVKQRYAGHRLNEFWARDLSSLYFVINGLLWAVSLSGKGFKAFESLFLPQNKKTWHTYCGYLRRAVGKNMYVKF